MLESPHDARPRLSPKGLAFLQRHEGVRCALYNDAAGHATIGYGHLVHRGACGTQPALESPFCNGITLEHCSQLLEQDAGAATHAVLQAIGRELLEHELDALVSFTFNVGAGALSGSTLRRKINSGAGATEITAAFLMWNKPAALIGRRMAEAALYVRGAY